MRKDKWKSRPISIRETDEEITHVLFIDENGDSDLSYVQKRHGTNKRIDENTVLFSVTGALCEASDLSNIKDNFNKIKTKFWPPDGCYNYKDDTKFVCFHSNEIRRQKGPFSKNQINYNDFMEDLSNSMAGLPILLNTCFINKYELYKKYATFTDNPYSIAMRFILERVVKFQLKDSDKLIIILESRGKIEDKKVLDTILGFINYGTTYAKPARYQKIIGVYFNSKRPDNDCKSSYFGLEVADLCGYPIFSYCRSEIKNKPFTLIEHKIYGFPNYKGKGIKKFP